MSVFTDTIKDSGLVIERRRVDELKPFPRNARTHSAKQISQIAASIREFGFVNPVLISPDGEITAGHGRVLAAKQLGMDEVPVIVLAHLTEAQRRALVLADNRIALSAGWDEDLLRVELSGLKDLNFDLSLTGFETRELDGFLLTQDERADDIQEVPATPVSRLGDLWLLGDHRVLCGDSTDEVSVARTMSGTLAAMVFTDPPYGVNYDGGTVQRTRLAGDDTTELYAPCCRLAFLFSRQDSSLYLWHAGVKGIAAAAAAAAAGYEIRCEIVWNKQLAQFGSLSAQYKQKHEPCYYCFKKGRAPAWYGPTNEVTVWDYDRSSKNEFHPTQKPVALAQRAIRNSTATTDTILDLFLGSGSTVIACETTQRRCCGLEIAPGYVDVIVQRWQKFTGREATLEGDGRTFAAVKQERIP